MERLPEIERRLIRMSMRHSVYIIFGLHPAYCRRGSAWEHVATGTLVRFKGRSCAVTDAHILRFFQDRWEEDPRVVLQIGGALLHERDVNERIRAVSDGSDLAIFDVTGIERDVTEANDPVGSPTFYEASEWPPDEVHERDVLFVGGYRDVGRSTSDQIRHVIDTFSNLSLVATDAFPDRFKCKLDRTGWVDALNPSDRRGVLEVDFSGLSGAPIYRLWTREQADEYRGRAYPIAMFPTEEQPAVLVGFVMEHSVNVKDTLVATFAGNIRRDGTLWGNTRR